MVIKMSEGEGKSMAQVHNIRAAKKIVETVKSTLGPMGMDKMMVDGGGNVIVTNDGATILRELDVAHPGGKMMVEVAKTQESLCYDGTTSTVVLAGQLLANSEMLFEKGLHPNVICRGYHEAAQMATKFLKDNISQDGSDKELLVKVARTAITGKTLENALDKVAALCVDAVKKAGDAESVRVLPLPGDSLEDSYLFNGVVVNKDYYIECTVANQTKVLLVNTGLTQEKSDDNVQVQLDAESYQTFKASSKDDILSHAKSIVALLPDGGVLFCRDSVDDHVCAFLKKNNVAVVRRVQQSTLKALSKSLGIEIAQTVLDIEESADAVIQRQRHNDVWYLFVEGDCVADMGTLILRGATTHTLEEVERGFDDALGVVSLVMNNDSYVYGGGTAYVEMAAHLRKHAATIGGRAQMAIEAFSDALETIPATIAENAGYDPLDTVLAMRHEILNDITWMGPDVEEGGLTDMRTLGVYEPTALVRQAVLSAGEVAIALLRIDDIIGRRPVE